LLLLRCSHLPPRISDARLLEITGRIGAKALTFVVYVEKVGEGPSWRYQQPNDGSWYQTTLCSRESSCTDVQ
jgi:hypothetical protein